MTLAIVHQSVDEVNHIHVVTVVSRVDIKASSRVKRTLYISNCPLSIPPNIVSIVKLLPVERGKLLYVS